MDELLLLLKGDESQVVIKALPKEDRASFLAGFNFNGNGEAPIFYHEFDRLRNGCNIRAAHEETFSNWSVRSSTSHISPKLLTAAFTSSLFQQRMGQFRR